mmetsp:Transcript_38348/g.78219  ORF Transcript_38348/g.78219 Transcript_38348/m.78219 type:complete len:281 (-) Transcript_38348:1819-2661(-)
MALKLTYFSDGKGRNELPRLIFAVGGVEYTDELIGYSQYLKMRDTGMLPWGQVPVLTMTTTEGKSGSKQEEEIFGQSCSIARYVAKVSNLYPTNDVDALRSDAVVDAWRDTLDLYYDCYFERKILGGRMQMVPRKPAERSVRLGALVDSELGEQFARFERVLEAGDGQVCVGEKNVEFPCWADLAIYDVVKTLEGPMTKEAFDKLMEDKTMLKSLVARIDPLETIQKHLKKYPYVDLSHMFARVPLWKRTIHRVLFPLVELVLSIKSRFSPRIEQGKKSN